MINLETIAKKIDSILNGTDAEIPTGLVSPSNDDYFFRVFSEGLYLSEVFDKNSGKNFIPVVVGAYGGENNPVAGLGEQDRNVMVQILFPVRFKQDMYAMEEYLDAIVVGRELTFGTQKAVCNMSPAQFGEIQDFDFNEFNKWVENIYLEPIEKMETYMSMTFNFYLSTAQGVGSADGFVYGNSYEVSLKIGTLISGTFTPFLTDANPVFVEMPNVASSEPASQQILGQSYSKGLSFSTAFSKQVTVYARNNSGYIALIQKYLDRDLQGLVVQIEETYDFGTKPTKTQYYYLSDLTITPAKGELLTISFDLGDYLEI